MALEPGKLDDQDNFINPDCMAKFMEDALALAHPELGQHDRRAFLIALSTGIINYLKAHEHDSFAVHVTVGSTIATGTLDIL